ncbi:MAG: hypothetical protein M0Z79_07040 [Nitrospiraceae bacterium]|nr:hypothetical protein [Nitrospiraceae bacterium]
MKDAKFYGLCLERLRFQIGNARKRVAESDGLCEGILLECYNTGDPEEIIDILELYDIEDRSLSGVFEKLDDLACTVSLLLREKIGFGLTGKGELGLYWAVSAEAGAAVERTAVYSAA